MGILWFIISYRNYHKLVGSIATGVIMFFSIEILCFLALTLTSKIYKNEKKLALKSLANMDYYYIDWNCLNNDSEWFDVLKN